MQKRGTVDRKAAVVFGLSTGVSLLALIGTASRAPLGGLAVGLVAVIDWREIARSARRDLRVAAGVVLAPMVPVGVALAGDFQIVRRFESALHGGSFGHRVETWPESLQGVLEYPVFGIGLGQHPNYLEMSVTPHNTFVLIVSGTGLLGLAVAIWFGAGLLSRAVAVRFGTENHYLGLFVGFFVSSLIVGTFHDINNFRSFWIGAGLLTASVCARKAGEDTLEYGRWGPELRGQDTSLPAEGPDGLDD